MGSYSEACAISGMEIAMGQDCLVALVAPKKWNPSEYEIIQPPIRGTYNDYGYLRVNDPMGALFGIESGGDYEPMEHGTPMWIDGKVFDFLGNIRGEFGHSTFFEDWQGHSEKLDRAIAQAREDKILWTSGALARPERPSDRMLWDGAIIRVIDEGPTADRIVAAILADKPLDQIISAYKRQFIVAIACDHLRKGIVPTFRGPQHGGGEGLIQFYEMVLTEARARITDDE